jgi:hypothetical protein
MGPPVDLFKRDHIRGTLYIYCKRIQAVSYPKFQIFDVFAYPYRIVPVSVSGFHRNHVIRDDFGDFGVEKRSQGGSHGRKS